MQVVNTDLVLFLIFLGKTSLATRYLTNEFSEDYYSTYYTENYLQDVPIPQLQTKVCLEIFDVQNPEEHSAMRDQYIRQADFFIITYSIDNRDSADEARDSLRFIERVKDADAQDLSILFVGYVPLKLNRE